MSKIKLSELLGYGGRIGPFSYPLGAGYLYSQPTPATTWTVRHNLNQKYVSVEVIDSHDTVLNGRYDYPTITFIDENTLTITFTYPQSGHALITSGTDTVNVNTVNGTVAITTGYLYDQPTPAPTWTINHNLNQKYVGVEIINAGDQAYDGRYDFPTITFVDANTVSVAFSYSLAGHAVITSGATNEFLANILANATSNTNSTYGNVDVAAYLQDPYTANVIFGDSPSYVVGAVGRIQSQSGVDLYAVPGADWAQLNYANNNFVAATTNGVEIDTYPGSGPTGYTWKFGTNGAIVFPDQTIQSTAYTGGSGGSSLPTNAVGYLYNDGSGTLTWSSTTTSYGDPNVASYLSTATISTTGNVTAKNFITTGNVYSRGNIAVVSNLPRNIYVNTVAPTSTQGNIGDIWYQTF
jgi:hypothetical protein